MKNKISALMDGELFEDEADILLDQLKRDRHAHIDWSAYHLIGDALRQPDYISRDISSLVRERMQLEPTILAPYSRGISQKVRNIALSAAASVMAFGVVAWMSVQIAPENNPQLAMQNLNIKAASMKIQSQSNDYLMAHQEFSPSNDMDGGAAYIRTVAYSAEDKTQ